MSREGEYLVFATEQYRHAKGLSGSEVIELFRRHGVEKYILSMFELFHIESEANMIAAVDEYISKKSILEKPTKEKIMNSRIVRLVVAVGVALFGGSLLAANGTWVARSGVGTQLLLDVEQIGFSILVR